MNSYQCNVEEHKDCTGIRASGFLCACTCHKPLNGKWPSGTWFQERRAKTLIKQANDIKEET